MADAYNTILVDKDAQTGIGRITLNRPERLNAINEEMGAELAEAVDDVANDDSVRVVILTGAGRAFCAGADTGGSSGVIQAAELHPENGGESVRRSFRNAQRLILGLHRMEKPVIGMINGVAAGAGFDVSCVCDLRVGATNTRFISSFVRIGLFPGYGGTWLYPRMLGSLGKAAELLFTGEDLIAEEAYRFGFLNKLVEPEKLEEETMAMAQKIADGPPVSMRVAKMLLYKGLEMDLETAMQMAAATETITITSEDFQEGLSAFRERRTPKFTGK